MCVGWEQFLVNAYRLAQAHNKQSTCVVLPPLLFLCFCVFVVFFFSFFFAVVVTAV